MPELAITTDLSVHAWHPHVALHMYSIYCCLFGHLRCKVFLPDAVGIVSVQECVQLYRP
jgi:hypothetical protein